MKIVLSRKGFDSASGGVPNPILPDGRLIPLPIPATRDPHSYGKISVNGMALGPLVEDLTGQKITGDRRCHLDPDLDVSSMLRPPGWRPAFGQINAAQSHLARLGIGIGDLFLFFGWFRAVEQAAGRWRYVRGTADLHVIYGWMQVGEVIALATVSDVSERLPAHADHPHVRARDNPSNTLYLASDRLRFAHLDRAGGGLFAVKSDGRVLTEAHQTKRSVWRLPAWFHPDNGTVLSYHTKPDRWALDRGNCTLLSVGRGQEFIVTPPRLEAVGPWLQSVFA